MLAEEGKRSANWILLWVDRVGWEDSRGQLEASEQETKAWITEQGT